MPKPFIIDIDEANQQLKAAQDRAAIFANAAKAVGLLCYYRKSGFCLTDCPGRIVCDVSELHPLPYRIALWDEAGTGGPAAGYHPGSLSDPRD